MNIVRIHIPQADLDVMQWVYCEQCDRKLERMHLESRSTVEIQCKCGHLNQFGVEAQAALVPDGTGGWIKQLVTNN